MNLKALLESIHADPEASGLEKHLAAAIHRAYLKTSETGNAIAASGLTSRSAEAPEEPSTKLDPTYKLLCDIQKVLNGADYPSLVYRLDAWLVDWLKGRFSHAIPMMLWCPLCHTRHVDKGKFATHFHHTHTCQNPTCGLTWRPAVVYTVGVQFLPGFKDA